MNVARTSNFQHVSYVRTYVQFYFSSSHSLLTLLEPQSRSGNKVIKFQVVCRQNGTAFGSGGVKCYLRPLPPIKYHGTSTDVPGTINIINILRGTIVNRTKYC